MELEKLSNTKWIEIVKNGTLDEVASIAYSFHKQEYNSDSLYLGNKIPYNIDYTSAKFHKTSFNVPTYGKYERRQISEKITENINIEEGIIGNSEPLMKHIKNEFRLTNAFVKCLIQKPGNCAPVHVDYNRDFLSYNEGKLDNLLAKDIKKYVWFLEDQEIGQMWAIGRDNISWKAGDVYQWPWYMPHATANSSNSDRKLLIICGC